MARLSILFTILSLLLLSSGACTRRAEFPEVRHSLGLSMEAVADTLVVPDCVVWTITMHDLEPELQAAKSASDVKLAAVLAVLGQAPDRRSDLRTGAARIERHLQRCDDGKNRPVQFGVRRTVTLRQDDLADVDATLDALVSSADVEVAYHYEVSDPEAVLRELRKRAMDKARAKVASLAAHAGLALGELRGVNVNEQRYHHRHRDRRQVELKGVTGPEARYMETAVRVHYETR